MIYALYSIREKTIDDDLLQSNANKLQFPSREERKGTIPSYNFSLAALCSKLLVQTSLFYYSKVSLCKQKEYLIMMSAPMYLNSFRIFGQWKMPDCFFNFFY